MIGCRSFRAGEYEGLWFVIGFRFYRTESTGGGVPLSTVDALWYVIFVVLHLLDACLQVQYLEVWLCDLLVLAW